MNAVVYARFSSHRQGEQSIEGQVAEAERFAKAHDLTIIHIYMPTGHKPVVMITGSNFSRCSPMQQSMPSMH